MSIFFLLSGVSSRGIVVFWRYGSIREAGASHPECHGSRLRLVGTTSTRWPTPVPDSEMLLQMAEEFVQGGGVRGGAKDPFGSDDGIAQAHGWGQRHPRGTRPGGSRAQHIAESVERATAPFQHALSIRSGTECVGHAIHLVSRRDGGIRFGVERGHALRFGWRRREEEGRWEKSELQSFGREF